MIRVREAHQREAIAEGRDLARRVAGDRLDFVDFFTGVDPVWAGVHSYETTVDGRSFRDTACCLYPWHASDGRVTVVLPTFCPPRVVVHELGHALDFVLGFRHLAIPVGAYESSNRDEAFAGAFTALFFRWSDEDDDAHRSDLATRAFFESLS